MLRNETQTNSLNTIIMIAIVLCLVLLIILVIGYLFKKSEDQNTQAESKIKVINDKLVKDNFNLNINNKFISFIEESKKRFEEYNELDPNASTIAEIKKQCIDDLNKFTSQQIYIELEKEDKQNEIVKICSQLKETSPATWFKKYGNEIERIKQKYVSK